VSALSSVGQMRESSRLLEPKTMAPSAVMATDELMDWNDK
jgi:hypothetical protein